MEAQIAQGKCGRCSGTLRLLSCEAFWRLDGDSSFVVDAGYNNDRHDGTFHNSTRTNNARNPSHEGSGLRAELVCTVCGQTQPSLLIYDTGDGVAWEREKG